MSVLITLWFIAGLITLIVMGLRKLFGSGHLRHDDMPAQAEPPNPGGFDPRKYRTQYEKEQWLIAYARRVHWERTQPRRPIPPPRDGVFE